MRTSRQAQTRATTGRAMGKDKSGGGTPQSNDGKGGTTTTGRATPEQWPSEATDTQINLAINCPNRQAFNIPGERQGHLRRPGREGPRGGDVVGWAPPE